MKLSLTAVLLVLITACNNNETTQKESPSMSGAYKMLSQHIKGGTTDTTYKSFLQQKIYTGTYMMYANVNPADSVSGFGVGTYSITGDTLTESVFYNGSDTTKSDTPQAFKLVIEKTTGGYQQVIPEIESQGVKYVLTESYETISKPDSTAIDGLWQMEKSYWTKGKDTFAINSTQYKIYHQGHFIWGQTYLDSLKKTHTGIGFGTFSMPAPDKVKENGKASTYSAVTGHNFDIDLQMNGADAFVQSITYKDSSKQVEFYRRVKK